MVALIHRPIAVLALTIAALVAGVLAARRVPVEWIPHIELPELEIHTSWPGATPAAIEQRITAPLERAVVALAGAGEVYSSSQLGSSLLRVEVAEHRNPRFFRAELTEAIAQVASTFPERVHPQVDTKQPVSLQRERGFMVLQLIGQDPERLRRFADDRIAPRLKSLPGVERVTIAGGRSEEIVVRLDPERLAAHGVRREAIGTALRAATHNRSYGSLRSGQLAFYLMTRALDRPSELRDLVIGGSGGHLIRLSDVGEVGTSLAPRTSIARVDGHDVVTLSLDRAPGKDILSTARAVYTRLGMLQGELPSDMSLKMADDKSAEVRAELQELVWRGGAGALLVFLTLFSMMRALRALVVVAVAVSVALAWAMGLLLMLDLSLNLLTIAGLVLLFGLLVDNAVLLVEELQRQLHRSGSESLAQRAIALKRMFRAIWFPLFAGTVTTLAALFPLLYLSGDLRDVFIPFGVVVGGTLAISLLSSAVLVTALARFIPSRTATARRGSVWKRLGERMCYVGGHWPRTTLLASLLAIGIPLWILPKTILLEEGSASKLEQRLAELYNRTIGHPRVIAARRHLDPALGGLVRRFAIGADFVGDWVTDTPRQLSVTVRLPAGTDFTEAVSIMERLESAVPEIAMSDPLPGAPAPVSTRLEIRSATSQLWLRFSPQAVDTGAALAIRDSLIREAQVMAGIHIGISGLGPQGYSGGGLGRSVPIVVEAHGSDFDELERVMERFATELATVPGMRDIDIHGSRVRWSPTQEVLLLPWKGETVRQTGVTARALGESLSSRLPIPGSFLSIDHPRRPLALRISEPDSADIQLASLEGLSIPAPNGRMVRIGDHTEARIRKEPGTIERYNQQYRRYIHVDFYGDRKLGKQLIRQALSRFSSPLGYGLELPEEAFLRSDQRGKLAAALVGTIGLVFLVLSALFESWKLASIAMLAVPFLLIGVSAAFLISNATVANGAFIGAILLIGVSVNDSILLLSRYRNLRSKAPSRSSATLARLAVRSRLRPMWTTTLTTIAGMLPYFVATDRTTFWYGLAITVVGGLLASTLLAPPAIVAMLSRVDG